MNRRPFFLALTAFFLLSGAGYSQSDLEGFFDHMDSFLGRHVSVTGAVDYTNIEKNDRDLKAINAFIKSKNYDELSGAEQKAYWINAYNFIVVREAFMAYPINSVQEVPGFFSSVKHELGEKKHTLDDIENELLRKEFPDARLHFVLNCGADGCPVLLNKAYRPKELDAQLDAQTKAAMKNEAVIQANADRTSAKISKIFFWFEEDFKREGGALTFINKYIDVPLNEDATINFMDYNWNLNGIDIAEPATEQNLQAFTPSALFAKGQWEFKTFFNLYTQTASFSNGGRTGEPRSTFFTSINQFLIGVSPNLNVGLDFWAKSVLAGGSQRENALNIFTFPNDTGFLASPTYIGPKIKVAPFKKIPRLSIQSTVLLPLGNDYESRERTDKNAFLFLEFDRYLWTNDIFFDYSISPKWQVFVRSSIWTSLPRNSFRKNVFVETPIAGFVSFFPTSRITFYGQTEYWPEHIEDNFGGDGRSSNSFKPFNNFFIQSGLGGKYQLIPGRLELEALYTNFWAGSTGKGAGNTFNLGVRVIR